MLPQFIYVLRARRLGMLDEGPTAAEGRILEQHAAYIRNMQSAGVVLLAGRTLEATPDDFGIVILQAPDSGFAGRVMRDDPFVRFGVAEGRLHPFRIATVGDEIGTLALWKTSTGD